MTNLDRIGTFDVFRMHAIRQAFVPRVRHGAISSERARETAMSVCVEKAFARQAGGQ
jgi:hypothetical protein